MNNITDDHVSPDVGSPISVFVKISFMLILGFVAAACGLWLMLPETAAGMPTSGFGLSKWIVLPIVIGLTVFMLKLIPGQIGQNLKRQYKIFNNKHYLGHDRDLYHDLWLFHRFLPRPSVWPSRLSLAISISWLRE